MNLLVFLGYIIQYKLSYDKSTSIRNIKGMLDESGAVWQKFAQMLSYNEDIIGQEIAVELQNMLCECPTHSHDYSRKIIKRDFGDKYDYDNMKLIGSGTIAQVYRVGEYAIKIKHPNVDEEVRSAIDTYNGVKDSFFFPSSLRSLCDIFFKGLKSQLSMRKEYKNGLLMKELLHKDTDPENNLFIIPQMIDYSEDCIIMTYEESKPILLKSRDAIDKHVLLKACISMNTFSHLCILHGFMHSDMHYGNFGIRVIDKNIPKIQLVIYDFGFMCDIRDEMSLEDRTLFLKSFISYDIIQTIILIFKGCEQSVIDTITQQVIVSKDKITMCDNVKKVVSYILFNGIQVQPHVFAIFSNSEKYSPVIKIVIEIEMDEQFQDQLRYHKEYGIKRYNQKYFPYDDCRILSLLS